MKPSSIYLLALRYSIVPIFRYFPFAEWAPGSIGELSTETKQRAVSFVLVDIERGAPVFRYYFSKLLSLESRFLSLDELRCEEVDSAFIDLFTFLALKLVVRDIYGEVAASLLRDKLPDRYLVPLGKTLADLNDDPRYRRVIERVYGSLQIKRPVTLRPTIEERNRALFTEVASKSPLDVARWFTILQIFDDVSSFVQREDLAAFNVDKLLYRSLNLCSLSMDHFRFLVPTAVEHAISCMEVKL